MALLSRFLEETQDHCLIEKSDRILVAFSGGKDSVCLLFLLHTLQVKLEIEVAACHIHHGIRGKEADEDLAFCRSFCKERKIPFFERRVDAPAYCKEHGLGLEEGARNLRYDALEEIADENGYGKIATAHTGSDQAETVLFRLIRGSGMEGVSGIPERRCKIIRPFLGHYQDEILYFLEENHIPFKIDSTNKDTIYARNRIRRLIMPELERINPSAEEALVRFGRIAEEQAALVESLCDRFEEEHQIDPNSGGLPISVLTKLNSDPAMEPVLRELLSRMAKKEKIVMNFQHSKAALSLLKNPKEGKIIEISGGFGFCIKGETLLFCKNESSEKHIQYQMKLSVGENLLPDGETVLTLSDKRCGKVENINKNLLIIHAASDKIKGDIFVRCRKNGDRVRIGNMTRSVKKLFQEAGIPLHLRDRIPLICDSEEILWIPFVGLCDRVRVSDTDEIFTMKLEGEWLREAE